MDDDQGTAHPDGMRIRAGDSSDVGAVLALFDLAVRWLVQRGRTGQWGTEPFSNRPNTVERFRGWASGGGLWIAEIGTTTVGAIAVGQAHDYAPTAPEPELYIQAFVTDRRYRGHGIGEALLAHARAEAIRRDLHLLRVDCWAGADQALVRYYERAGFTRAERFTVGDWPGQILHQRC